MKLKDACPSDSYWQETLINFSPLSERTTGAWPSRGETYLCCSSPASESLARAWLCMLNLSKQISSRINPILHQCGFPRFFQLSIQYILDGKAVYFIPLLKIEAMTTIKNLINYILQIDKGIKPLMLFQIMLLFPRYKLYAWLFPSKRMALDGVKLFPAELRWVLMRQGVCFLHMSSTRSAYNEQW